MDAFFEQLAQQGRIESPRFRLAVHDLRSLLERFAYDQSFSADSLGGGRDSNVKLIPFMVQLGLFLLDRKASSQRATYDRAMAAFVAEEPSSWPATSPLVCVCVCLCPPFFAVLPLPPPRRRRRP